MYKKVSDKVFLKIIENAPLVSIDLIVQSTAGRILLGRRKNTPAKDSWFVPGGCIRKGETLEEAFQRIAHDELTQNFSWKDAEFLGIPSWEMGSALDIGQSWKMVIDDFFINRCFSF